MNEHVIQRARQLVRKYSSKNRANNWTNCIVSACIEVLGCRTWEDVQKKFLRDNSENIMAYYEIEEKIHKLYPYGNKRVMDNE